MVAWLPRWICGNYLRVRGEYPFDWAIGRTPWELPPRARRIHIVRVNISPHLGTTSACAENTEQYEYVIIAITELPPRARRIQGMFLGCVLCMGTTSACAENTTGDTSARSNNWNYLRVRGEYCASTNIILLDMELPPRARRIHAAKSLGHVFPGTTSACAENTILDAYGRGLRRNYLRVRGEYTDYSDLLSA